MSEREDDYLKHWGIAGMKWKHHKPKKDDPEKERVLNNFKASIKNLIKKIKAAKKTKAIVKKSKKVKKKVKKVEKKVVKKLAKKKDHAKKKLKELLKKHGSKKAKHKGKSKKSGSGKKGRKGGSGRKGSGSKDSVTISKKLKGDTKEQQLDAKLKDLFSDHDARGKVISTAKSTKIEGLRSGKDPRLNALVASARAKAKKKKHKK